MSKKHATEDSELKSYLDGSDGLSDTWRQVADETPPARLDARIREAAYRAASPAPAQRSPRRALAASFMVGTLATMLYFSQREGFEVALTTETTAGFASSAAESEALPAPPAPAANTIAIRDLQRQAPTQRAGTGTPQSPEELQVRGTLAPQAADETPIAVTGSRFSQGRDESLQEVKVTGSLQDTAASAGYRDTREGWLAHLRQLRDDVQDSQGAFAAMLQRQFDEESALFLATYPDADLAAELDAVSGN